MAIFSGITLRITLTVLVGLGGLFFVKLYRVRSRIRALQRQGLVCT